MNTNRIMSVSVSFLFVLISACSLGNNREEKGELYKPNIILFLVDDYGWSDIGFRNSDFESPNIDKLASRSLSFERAYIASPTCSPSRATLLTGKHPAKLKIVRHIPTNNKYFDKYGRTKKEFNYLKKDPAQFPCRNWLPLNNITYAEILRDSGYYNYFIGKWHLGHEEYHPIHQGFDEQTGVTNFGHPKSYYPPYFNNNEIFSDEKEKYLTDKLTDEAVKFIENYKLEKPFLLNFWYYSVHSPHEGRKDLVEHFEEKGFEGNNAHHLAMVKAVDESIGRVLTAINEKGLKDSTIIIFLSDQGGAFDNKPLRGGKMGGTALYEGGARVPFFIYWPGVTKPSKNYSIVQSTDIFPTIIEIVGGNPAEYYDVDGISLIPVIKSGKNLMRDAVFAYRAYEDLYSAVWSDEWKLLAYRSGKMELYNLNEDIGETEDLVKTHPEKTEQLAKKLYYWEKEMGVKNYSGVKLIEK